MTKLCKHWKILEELDLDTMKHVDSRRPLYRRHWKIGNIEKSELRTLDPERQDLDLEDCWRKQRT